MLFAKVSVCHYHRLTGSTSGCHGTLVSKRHHCQANSTTRPTVRLRDTDGGDNDLGGIVTEGFCPRGHLDRKGFQPAGILTGGIMSVILKGQRV